MGTGDNNLFNPEYTSGDLSKIQPIVKVVQMVSVWVISIIGLSITISTILKQAVHGLYATNTQFWDKVDEVHTQKLGATVDKGGNQIQIILGFGLSFVFSLMPNIKRITEFDGDTVDPKTFFTKSLPMSCLFLFIGVFIYYGYTTKIGEKVSLFGTELIDNFFLQIDPLEWASKIPTSFAKVNLSTSGSKADFDQAVNDVTKKAYASLKTDLGDIAKEMQPRTALDVESWVISCMEEVREYTDTDKWKMSFNARTTPESSDLSRVHNGQSADGREKTFAWERPVAEFKSGSASPNMDTDFLRVDITFTQKAETTNTSSVACIMHGGSFISGSKESTIDLGISTSGGASIISRSASGKIGDSIVNIQINGGKLTITKKSGKNVPDKVTEITDISGLQYSINSSSHPIKTIDLNGDKGNAIEFTPTSGTVKVDPWNYGDVPKTKGGISESKSDDEENDDEEEETTKDPRDVLN